MPVPGPPSSDHPPDQLPIAQTPIAPPQVTTAISSPFAIEPNAFEIQPIANAPIQKRTAGIPAEGSTKRQKKREIFQEQLDAAIAKLDDAMKRIDILTAKANQHDALTVRCDALEGFIIRRPR
ncbi:hypothetical protein NEUTE2DRAFT_128289 [Neurospora tetrasperma FGSC 2509]|nr:hypothetical protein NEUTE2DRAFT_128289 [Neurospora tetrasperma FGSC 2509]